MSIELSLSDIDPLRERVPLLAVLLFQDEDSLPPPLDALNERVGGALAAAREAGDFQGREDDALLFYLPHEVGDRTGAGDGSDDDTGSPEPRRLLVLGGGSSTEGDLELLRKTAGRAVRHAESLSLTRVAVLCPRMEGPSPENRVQALAEGLALAAWDFRELRTDPDEDDPPPRPLVSDATVIVQESTAELERALLTGHAFAEGENLARTLQSRPGNIATPTHLASVALQLAEEYDFRARILGPGEMQDEDMGALLSVAKGSDEEPRLIVLEHRRGPEDMPFLALVGKGLTFDAGGISLKPAKGMEDMKYDMSGGAAVLGAMKAIGALELPLNVVGVVPSSENLINGSANKPGDVIRTRSGKTVEVINTDAEGRLILSDALSYTVDRYSPSAMVDCATLTGACVVALGHHAAAVLGSDETLVEELREAGDRSGERCWPLPLWKPYRKQLDSEVADLKNVGGRPAGAITAATFLREFVGETSWAHLDIAGTAYGESDLPYRRKGGFGFPTRLLLEWVRSRTD